MHTFVVSFLRQLQAEVKERGSMLLIRTVHAVNGSTGGYAGPAEGRVQEYRARK